MARLDEFLPERIGSSGDRASFWPETLFVESEVPVALNDHWDETPEGLLSASGLFHENIHWSQCNASTLGVFTFLLRHRRAELIECYLRELNLRERRTVLRRWEKGESLWRFDGGALQIDGVPSDRMRVSAHWNALLVCDLVFRRGHPEMAAKFCLHDLLRVAYLHADGAYEVEHITRSPDPYFSAEVPSEADARPSEIFSIFGKLSCRALEECSAVLNQREFYGNGHHTWGDGGIGKEMAARLEDAHRLRWEMHQKDPGRLYVACVNYFAEVNKDLDINDDGVLGVLFAIIDISLNPPLPPFCNLSPRFPKDGTNELRMGDLIQLHPVFRFIALVDALSTVGLPKGGNIVLQEPEAYNDYAARLCKAANLMDPRKYLFSNPIHERGSPIWRTIEDSPLTHVKNHVLSHHCRSTRIRRRQPSAFASPAHNLLYLPHFAERLEKNKLTSVLVAPMQLIEGAGYFSGITDNEYFNVLESVSYSEALSSFLRSPGSFASDGLPRDDAHRRWVERSQKILLDRLMG